MLYDDPGAPRREDPRGWSIHVRMMRDRGEVLIGDRLLQAVVRRRLTEAGLDAFADDSGRGLGLVVPHAAEATRKTVERVLEPLAAHGLVVIEVRPAALA